MIIDTPQDVTEAVLGEIAHAPDARTRELMSALVRHLHDFAREVRLTEAEFQQACAWVVQLGQVSNESHNEAVLMAGSLGLSALVCLLNNGEGGRRKTTANTLGPFWRPGAPRMAHGASIVRSETPGVPLFVNARVVDPEGSPVPDAEVDIWQASTEGFYENQDPTQADWNLRGTFVTDAQGRIAFRTVKPAGYPIPITGPVGAMLRALGRHNMRPAHVHFLIAKPGFKTQFSQVYANDDPHLDSDVQFGVTRTLIGDYRLHEHESAPASDVTGPWYSLEHTFTLERGDSRLPRPPISGKQSGARPELAVLERGARSANIGGA